MDMGGEQESSKMVHQVVGCLEAAYVLSRVSR